MRILLVQPGIRPGTIGFHVAAQTEPLALETLAATLPDHDVEILDLRLEADLPRALAQFAPEVVAVTALTTEVYAAQAVLDAVKAYSAEIRILQANKIVVWGAFIIDPDWTADDFKLLEDYVAAKNITHAQFTVLTPLPGTDLYRQRRDQLLTNDYTCFDALHAVLPTKLPREEFYRRFAGLNAKPNIQANYDLVSEGRISFAEFKRGYRILKSLGQWEKYTENDPILRNRPCGRSRPVDYSSVQPATAPSNAVVAVDDHIWPNPKPLPLRFPERQWTASRSI